MKFNSQELYADFPEINLFKKYNIENLIKITFIPTDFDYFIDDNINLFDIVVLRAIFVFYLNGFFRISYENIFKYLSSNKQTIVTEKQLFLIKNSVSK